MSRLAIVSVVLSLGSVLIAILSGIYMPMVDERLILALMAIGIVAGIVSLVRISRSQGRLTGRLIGWLGVLIVPLSAGGVIGSAYMGFYSRHTGEGPSTSCLYNLKHVATSLIMYCEDYDGMLPPADRWNGSLRSYNHHPRDFFCPKSEDNAPSYGMNGYLNGISLTHSLSAAEVTEYVLLADSKPGLNVHGGPEILPEKPRHTDGDNYALRTAT